MGSNPSQFKDDPANPVKDVSWDDTKPFLTKLNDARLVNQWRFGLPTEAQWEYACRAGTKTAWSFGDSNNMLSEYAWTGSDSKGKPHPVGKLKPNFFGIHDVHGNVWEWCNDFGENGYYANAPEDDPPGPSVGSVNVLRGGCWHFNPEHSVSMSRFMSVSTGRLGNHGFRLALIIVGTSGNTAQRSGKK